MEANPDQNMALRARKICRRWQEMSGALSVWRAQWQEIADLMMPRKAGMTAQVMTPGAGKEARLFDTTAGDALMTMAGGLMSWTTPANEAWFNFQPVAGLRDRDPVKLWLADCSQRQLELLANSSFYTERHEDLLNHCCFGLSAMYVGLEGGRLRFESLPVGSFAIEENAFGEVDTLFREMDLTARQAVEMFGEERLPPKILACWRQEEKAGQMFKFIHAVYPREEGERPQGAGRLADWGKAWASCYVECGEKVLVKESGYDSFPFSVGRYLKWSALGCKSPYGYGPGFAALPDVRQVNFLQMMMDVAAEKMVRPAMIAPEEMEGDLILSAGGITYMPSSLGVERWPRPVQQVGDYGIGHDRIRMRQEAIRTKFHYDLFNLFAKLDRPQMTAREVAERAAEKITLITPAFSRLVAEKDTPMLQRLFTLSAEAGLFAPPPAEAVEGMEGYMMRVPTPSVDYTSRLALAVQQLHHGAFERQLEGDMAVARFDPSVMDNYNWDAISRDRARSNGMPVGWLREEKAVAQMRQARADAAAAAQGLEMAQRASQAVKNVGGPEQAGKMLEGLAGGGLT
ncbi:portal protein [Prosthecobacter sp. SYSU 5D2]|uniref:portal protein n=1 Tax=Prosthecobacter sp. SYSU 5D2 TaxID=3134134 RepID=UPI0031FF1403